MTENKNAEPVNGSTTWPFDAALTFRKWKPFGGTAAQLDGGAAPYSIGKYEERLSLSAHRAAKPPGQVWNCVWDEVTEAREMENGILPSDGPG